MSTYIIFNQFEEEKIILTKQLIAEWISRGHIVIYYSGLKYKQEIKKMGAEFREYPVVCQPYFQDNKLSPFNQGKEQFHVHEQIAKRLEEEVVIEQPTCIVYDSDCLFAKMIAKQANIPAVCLIAGYVLTDQQMEDFKETSNNKLEQLKQYVSDFMQKIEVVSTKGESAHRVEGKSFNELNLICTFKEFQPYAALLDKTFDYVGYPIDYQTSSIETIHWDSFKPPYTYVSMTHKTLLSEAMIQQLCVVDGTVLIDTECIYNEHKLVDLPHSIKLINHKLSESDWDHLDIVITDAGLNLTHLALKHGVLQLVFPKTELQGLMASRIESCLLGIWCDACDGETIKQSFDLLFNYERYKANAKLFATSYAKSGSGRKMMLKIEKFLKGNNV
ncbi:MAG TPA: hypothetical protein DCY20_09270 [Firmicutes bacterium]|nr:hypothetical protein [Bacillota bacterium]